MVSCRYNAASFMLVFPLKANRPLVACPVGQPSVPGSGAVRVKSKQPSNGMNAGFTEPPGLPNPPQAEGLVNAGLVSKLPSAFKQTAFTVGSTMPNLSFSESAVFSNEIPAFTL